MAPEKMVAAINRLVRIGLLQPHETDPTHFSPISPDIARARVLSPLQRQINTVQDSVSQLRGELDALTEAYEHSLHQRRSRYQTQTVPDLTQVRELISGFAAEAEEEVLTSQPGGARPEEVLAESLSRTDNLLRRGVRMHTLYQHTARFSPPTVAYVEHVTALGGEVRTTADGFARCLLFDRRVAVIGLPGSLDGASVVRDPSFLTFMVDSFQRCWNGATPLPTRNHRRDTLAAVTGVRKAIAALLISGQTDHKIAQRVGLSLRTCQRHIADIMGSLGAQNRLQLGYLLANASLDEERPIGEPARMR